MGRSDGAGIVFARSGACISILFRCISLVDSGPQAQWQPCWWRRRLRATTGLKVERNTRGFVILPGEALMLRTAIHHDMTSRASEHWRTKVDAVDGTPSVVAGETVPASFEPSVHRK